MVEFSGRLKRCRKEDVMGIEDMLTNILIKLPVKSLLTCKLVCKSWRRLICSSGFIRLHLIQSRENDSFSVLINGIGGRYGRKVFVNKIGVRGSVKNNNLELTQNYRLPLRCQVRRHYSIMISSFHGLLFCMKARNRRMHLFNPATGKLAILPRLDGAYRTWGEPGVWFGPTADDLEYKVFQFLWVRKPDLYECMVYSSSVTAGGGGGGGGGGSWRSIGFSQQCPVCYSKHVCVNGSVYWLSWSESEDGGSVESILAIDGKDEKIRVIGIPAAEGLVGSVWLRRKTFLVNNGGCLCLVVLCSFKDENNGEIRNRFDVWVRQEEELRSDVWIKKVSDLSFPTFYVYELQNVIGVKENILFVNTPIDYFFYNMENKSCMDQMKWQDGRSRSLDLSHPVVYTESLLDPY